MISFASLNKKHIHDIKWDSKKYEAQIYFKNKFDTWNDKVKRRNQFKNSLIIKKVPLFHY